MMTRKVVLLALAAALAVVAGCGSENPPRTVGVRDRATGKPIPGAIAIAGPAAKTTGGGPAGLFRGDQGGRIELPGVFLEGRTVLTVWAPGYEPKTMALPAPATPAAAITLNEASSDPAAGPAEVAELKRLLTRLEQTRATAGGSFTYQEGITDEELKDELTTELEIATMLAEDYREQAELLDYSEPADGETSPENE